MGQMTRISLHVRDSIGNKLHNKNKSTTGICRIFEKKTSYDEELGTKHLKDGFNQ